MNPLAVTAEQLEKAVRAEGGLCSEFMDVKHTVRDGVYTRSGIIRAGKIIIGTVHLKKNIFHLAVGQIAIFDNHHGARLIEGPHSEISLPGIQRIGIALTDCLGSNIFETGLSDWREIEREMFQPLTLPANIGTKLLELADLSGCQLRLNENQM